MYIFTKIARYLSLLSSPEDISEFLPTRKKNFIGTPVCRLCGRYLAILGRPIRVTVPAVTVAQTALVGSLIRSSNLPHSLQRGVHIAVQMYDCRNVSYIRLFTFPCEPEGSLLDTTDVPYQRLRRWSFGSWYPAGRRGISNRESRPYRDSMV